MAHWCSCSAGLKTAGTVGPLIVSAVSSRKAQAEGPGVITKHHSAPAGVRPNSALLLAKRTTLPRIKSNQNTAFELRLRTLQVLEDLGGAREEA